jgi:hypothetical protein
VGFVSPQFDFIDGRFTHRRMKTLEVIFTQDLQALSNAPQEIAASASIINLGTGQLQPGVSLVVTDVDPGVAVLPNKICDLFLVTWQIVDASGGLLAGPFTTTVSDAVDVPGAGIGPSQTVVQKHDIQIGFCVIPVDTDDDAMFDTIYVTLHIDFCLVVAQEVVLKVNAAQPFCP